LAALRKLLISMRSSTTSIRSSRTSEILKQTYNTSPKSLAKSGVTYNLKIIRKASVPQFLLQNRGFQKQQSLPEVQKNYLLKYLGFLRLVRFFFSFLVYPGDRVVVYANKPNTPISNSTGRKLASLRKLLISMRSSTTSE
ncbi:8857_t:CDS:2, partial [Gigaspora rosea]